MKGKKKGQEALELDYGITHRYINFLVEECKGTATLSGVCISPGIDQGMLMCSRSNSNLATYIIILLLLP